MTRKRGKPKCRLRSKTMRMDDLMTMRMDDLMTMRMDDLMTMKLTIEVPFKTESLAKKALAALKGELTFQGRAKASLTQRKNTITAAIEAEDLASLHAAAGSHLRALKVVTGVQKFAEE